MEDKVIYNKELKERFLENYNEDTAQTYRNTLYKISESEEFYNKDCFNFNYEQLDNAFKSLQPKTLASARTVVSRVSEYIAWANQNGYVKTKIDISELFNKDKIKEYVWKHAQLRRLISREEVLAYCDDIYNPIDKILLVGLFEGINGKEWSELINLKCSDINFNTGEFKLTDLDGSIRQITITDERVLKIFKEATDQTEYYINNGEPSTAYRTVFPLTDSPYVLRKMIRKNIDESLEAYEDDKISNATLRGKAILIFKGVINPTSGKVDKEPYLSDARFLNLTNIHISGYYDYCYKLEKEKGELSVEDYCLAFKRYGIKNESLVYKYRQQYGNWKEKYKDVLK